MKKFLLLLIAVFSLKSAAQNIGINATGANADPSAALDVVSTNKGLLIPRVSLTALNSPLPITAPLISLMVYNTAFAGTSPNNVVPGYYYWDGAKWISINGSTSGGLNWNILGNAGTNASLNFLGTSDNQDLVFKTNNTEKMRILGTGNIGINTTTPTEKLHVSQGNIKLTNNGYSGITNASYNSSFQHPVFMGIMARGTEAAPTYPISGDALNSFIGRDAIDYFSANYGGSGIYMHTTENYSSTNKGTNITFHTTANGTNTITQRVIINHNGNVGVGTAAPAAMLHVGGVSAIGIPGFESTPSWPATVGGLSYDSWPIVTGAGTGSVVGYHQNGGDMNNASVSAFTSFQANQWPINWTGNTGYGFRASVAAGANRWAFYADNAESFFGGNVGIGTVPSYNLQVSSRIAAGVAGTSSGAISIFPNNASSWFHIDNRSDNTLRFSHGVAVGGSDIMTLTQFNLGLGTTTPNNRLEITSAAVNTSGLRFTNLTSASPNSPSNGKALSVDASGDVILVPAGAATSTDWSLIGNAGTTPGTNFLGTTDANDLVFKTNNTEAMRVLTSGKVGIGTALPTALFANSPTHPGDQAGVGTQTSKGIDWTANGFGYSASLYNEGVTVGSNGVLVKVADASANTKAFTVNSGALLSGTDLLTVLGDGNIGVGTTTPTDKLQVNGRGEFLTTINDHGIRIKAEATNAESKLQFTDNAAALEWGSIYSFSTGGGELEFNTASSPKMTIKANGNTGIGITNPSYKLEVGGGINATPQVAFTGGGSRLFFTPRAGYYTIGNSTIGEELAFATGNNVEAVRISGGGNVGIGTSAPSCKLDVVGGHAKVTVDATNGILGNIQLAGKNSTAIEPNLRNWTIYNMNQYGPYNGLVFWEYYDRNNNGLLCDDNSNDCLSRMVIQNGDGHVGIGVNVPTSQLDITNATTFKTLNALKNFNGLGNTDAAFIGGVDAGFTNTGVYFVQKDNISLSSTGTFLMNVVSNNVSQVVVNGAGQVGIGTTGPTPTSLLSVNGDADKIGGGAWSVFSDKRVKQNINKYNKGLDYILKINPVSFEYNGKGGYKADGKTYVGVIAQEIEEVLPGTVSKVKTTDFDDQRLFNASELTFTLINAVKEQQQQFDNLKAENKELKNNLVLEKTKLKTLEEKIITLEANANKLNELEAKLEILTNQLGKTNLSASK